MVEEAIESIEKHSDAAVVAAVQYLRNLAIVLSHENKNAIPKREICEAPENDLVGPYSIGELANGPKRKDGSKKMGLLGISETDFRRKRKARRIIAKKRKDGWYVHRKHLNGQ
jgi:hypothetical protein